jgi:hypothetical protein
MHIKYPDLRKNIVKNIVPSGASSIQKKSRTTGNIRMGCRCNERLEVKMKEVKSSHTLCFFLEWDTYGEGSG